MKADEVAETIGSLGENGAEGTRNMDRTAIYIAFLAMMMAVTSLGGSNAGKEMINNNIQASDVWNFYQAKTIRQTMYKVSADEAELILADPALPEETRLRMQKRLDSYRATVARYDSEPETGEGRKELLARAKQFEAVRDVAAARDPYFDYGEVLLQIAVVLASVSLITGGTLVLGLSGVLAAVGSLLTLNGYTLLFDIPFLS